MAKRNFSDLGGQEALDDICRNSRKHLIPDHKDASDIHYDGDPQHSNHDWGYLLYLVF
jgi:hypothetical protein